MVTAAMTSKAIAKDNLLLSHTTWEQWPVTDGSTVSATDRGDPRCW